MKKLTQNLQKGFSLLELLVAIAITGIVLAGVMNSMNSLSSKTSSNDTDLELKAQLAFAYIGDAIKEAGASVCDNLVRGMMADRPRGDSSFIKVSQVIDDLNQTAVDGLGRTWSTNNITPGSFINDGIGTLYAPNRAPNRSQASDMFNVVSTGEKVPVLNFIDPGLSAAEQLNRRQVGPMIISNRPNNVPQNAVLVNPKAVLDQYTFVLTNCRRRQSEIFEATLNPVNPGNYPTDPRVRLDFVGGGLSMRDAESGGGTLEVAALRSETYFINNTNAGFSLSRFYTFNNTGSQPLVFGIEMMAIQWGVDTNDDFLVDRFVRSDNLRPSPVTDGIDESDRIRDGDDLQWDQVVAVRVDLMVTDPDATGNLPGTYQLTFPKGSNQVITYTRGQNPTMNGNAMAGFNNVGHYARKVYSRTYALRNKVGS